MKNCLNCGTGAPEDATNCAACGREFAYGGSSGEAASEVSVPSLERPDGSTVKGLGLALIILAIVLGLWSALMPVTAYSFSSDIDPGKVATKALLAWAAEAFFGLGLVLWLAGYIVYAISFLPGKDDQRAQDR